MQHTLVIVVIHELVWGDHVEQLQYSTFLRVGRSCPGQHGHGGNAHFDASYLSDADAGLLNPDLLVTEVHVIKTLERDVRGRGIDVFAESNALGLTC